MGYKIERNSAPRSKKAPQKTHEELPHKLKAQTQSRRANACPRVLRPFPPPVVRYSYDTESKSLLPQSTRRSPPKPLRVKQPRTSKPVKRKRDAEEQENLKAPAKRRRSSVQLPPRQETSVDRSVFQWLDTIPNLRRSLENSTLPSLLDAYEMPPPKKDGKKSNYSASEAPSQKSKDSGTASVTDTNYLETLGHYNIAIEDEQAPTEVIRQAVRMFSRARDSPEPDDLTANDLRDLLRRIKDADEDMVMRQIGGIIVPAIDKLPDNRLNVLINQLWTSRAHVPPDPDLYEPPQRLPKPKPDIAFGYSKEAFTTRQDSVLRLLISDIHGESFSVPCQDLRFPFLSIEFKSAAKGGNWHDGLKQLAGTGAVAMNGKLKLSEETFGVEAFKFDEPQFYSVTLDQKFALVNVHWVGKKPKGGYSFHLETVSEHALRDPVAIKALRRTIKNIIDDGAGTRLQVLTEAIDKYMEVLDERKAKAREQASEAEQPPAYPSPAAEASSASAPKGKSTGKGTGRPKQPAKEKKEVKGTRGSKRNAKDMT